MYYFRNKLLGFIIQLACLWQIFRKRLRKKKLGVAVQNNIAAGFGKRSYLLRLNKFSDWVRTKLANWIRVHFSQFNLCIPFAGGLYILYLFRDLLFRSYFYRCVYKRITYTTPNSCNWQLLQTLVSVLGSDVLSVFYPASRSLETKWRLPKGMSCGRWSQWCSAKIKEGIHWKHVDEEVRSSALGVRIEAPKGVGSRRGCSFSHWGEGSREKNCFWLSKWWVLVHSESYFYSFF